MKKPKQRPTGRRLALEALEPREMLAADWYVQSAGLSSLSASELELWDLVNRMRISPSEELYHIIDMKQYAADPTKLVAYDSRITAAINDSILTGNADTDKIRIEQFLADWLSLPSAEPLAVSSHLSKAAENHNQTMNTYNKIDHQVITDSFTEKDLAGRVTDANFNQAGETSLGEICAYKGSSANGFSVASYLFTAFTVDWGAENINWDEHRYEHRDIMMSSDYSEIGIDLLSANSTSVKLWPYTTTVDFGTSVTGARTDGAFLFGLIYDDASGDNYYSAGEGVANATVTIAQTGENRESITLKDTYTGLASYGGYQIWLIAGSYTVTVQGGKFGTAGFTRSVTIEGGENQKLDFRTQDIDLSNLTLDLDDNPDNGSGVTVTYAEGNGALTKIAPNLTLQNSYQNDPTQTAYLYRAVISMTDRPDGSNESLVVDTACLGENMRVISMGANSNELMIFGRGTLAEYQQVLASLSYKNVSEFSEFSADGTMNRTITVTVYNGLGLNDPNAFEGRASAEAVIQIAMKPSVISISDAEVWEGDFSNEADGLKKLTFNVTLDRAARTDVEFSYELTNDTAVAGTHFIDPTEKRITIATGEISATFEIYILGDFLAGNDIQFKVQVAKDSAVNGRWDDVVATGTIKDDDTPRELASSLTEWRDAAAYSFEKGDRRYLYSLTPDASGLVRWSVVGSGEVRVTVYELSHGNPELVSSKWIDGRLTAEWNASAETLYIVKITGPYTYRDSLMTQWAVTENSTLLVDHLLDDQGRLSVALHADGITVGGQWNLSFSNLPNFTLAATMPNASIEFFMPAAATSFDTTSQSLGMGEQTISLSGFGNVVFLGSDNLESLTLVGSDGDDTLEYAKGSGTFTTHVGTIDETVYAFSKLTEIMFDGGSGGSDTARLRDTSYDDSAYLTSGSLDMAGGGYRVGVAAFTDITLTAQTGGANRLEIRDENWNSMLLQSGSVQIEGTRTDGRTFACVATGFSVIDVNADQSEGSVTIITEKSAFAEYDPQIGYAKTISHKTGAMAVVAYAKILQCLGFDTPETAAALPTANGSANQMESPLAPAAAETAAIETTAAENQTFPPMAEVNFAPSLWETDENFWDTSALETAAETAAAESFEQAFLPPIDDLSLWITAENQRLRKRRTSWFA